jgi:hypothetical protein
MPPMIVHLFDDIGVDIFESITMILKTTPLSLIHGELSEVVK